jgi:hypothetical protein
VGHVKDMLDFVGSPWVDILMAIVLFSLAPDIVLRLLVFFYPKGSDRRKELIAELRVVPRKERPFWVAEQITFIISEGFGDRLRNRRNRRSRLAHGVQVRDLVFSWGDYDLLLLNKGTGHHDAYFLRRGVLYKTKPNGKRLYRGPALTKEELGDLQLRFVRATKYSRPTK